MKEFLENRLKLKRRILVVDDEEIERKMLKRMLQKDYRVFLAADGQEALSIMKENQDTLSLVLLDLLMPKMNGYDLLAEVAKNENLRKIPIIVLTADNSAEVKSLTMGAADFIPKPYDIPEVVLTRINKTILLYESLNLISATKRDSLTGVLQWKYFMNYVGMADNYAPEQDRDILVLDINRFHIINEIHGRHYGDRVLAAVGKTITEYIDDKYGVSCRSGTNSFYIYLFHQDNPEELLWKIHLALEDALGEDKISIRMGVYSHVDKNLEIEKRFDCALLACKSIKENRKGDIAYYDIDMHIKEHYEERLMQDMEKGIAAGEFEVYYQPKFAIQAEQPYLSSSEALIRWKHHELGVINPDTFIPIFEKNGMIQKLDQFIWKTAANQVMEWKRKFGVTIPISVNVSRIDLLEPNFVETICKIVRDAQISPAEYMIEITESAYTEDSQNIIDIVQQLRNFGFHIEMDDFGTGYSSLNMISSLPIDVLKLDMAFVKHIHEDPKALRLVEIVMEIARLLNVKVVAEGVEVEAQHELLKKIGVNLIQGFYYSRPVPAKDFEAFIKERVSYDYN
ncbi:EAL domain-containing protein [uncultured Treponema sp.]|uniref:two-component system response regulator n=1 Tax=uncultured Treponema sp. TaxID=162155 RepID=UPI0025E348FE|nr:EAL domain-containing protein [uncultured Treponema sp.]